MVGNVVTSSAPTRGFWNAVLEVPWARPDVGDWLDAAQVAQGALPYATAPAITAVGRFSVSVTVLVQRWVGNNTNRGFFLKARANAFPIVFAGRTAPVAADRPELTVVTSAGTFRLGARANACWNSSTYSVVSSSALWELRAGQQFAILQFDLSQVTADQINFDLHTKTVTVFIPAWVELSLVAKSGDFVVLV